MRRYHVKKLIYAASSSCYGIPKHYPTKESEIIDPKYPYALTKKIGEDLVMHWSKVYDLNCTSLRLFNVYGPRVKNLNDYGAMFGIFLAQKLAGKPLTVVGNGNQSRDFTYVTDICDAFYKSYKKKISKGKIYNVGSGKTVSINKIVYLLKSKKKLIPKRPGEPSKTFANISKIKKELNWRPNIPIEKGIKIMIKNINNWKKAPVWDKKKIAKKTKLWFKYLKK
jgi:UDP-glucose 4-epimerase